MCWWLTLSSQPPEERYMNQERKINDYYNQEDLQQLFDFGRDKMHRFLLSGLLPTVKVGGRYYISKEAFDRWMRNNAGKVIDF